MEKESDINKWRKKRVQKPLVLIVRATPLLEPRVQRIALTLSDLDFKVAILLWDRGNLGGVPRIDDRGAYNAFRLRIGAPSGSLSLLLFLPLWWIAETIMILRYRPKIVHAGDLVSAIPATFASIVLGYRTVYDIFDFYSQMSLDDEPMNSGVRSLVTWMEQLIIQLVDAVIVAHEYQLRLIGRSRLRVRIACIYHSPDSNEYEDTLARCQRPGQNGLTILYSGMLEKGRGVYELVRAIDGMEKVTVVMTGFGEEAKSLEYLSRSIKNLKYLGYVTREEQLQRMLEADVMAIIYDPHIPVFGVASPSKMYEAMMFGKPVLVSKGTVAEKIAVEEKCGLAVEFGNVEELRRTILLLSHNKRLRNELGRNARRAYERKYNWNNSKQRLIRMYKSFD